MLKTTKNITISGTVLTEDGKDIIMYLNATIQENGNTTVSKTIQNKELYIENKAMCNEDYDSFEAEVDKLIS